MPEKERGEADSRTDFEKLRGCLEGRDRREINSGEFKCNLDYRIFGSGYDCVNVYIENTSSGEEWNWEVSRSGLVGWYHSGKDSEGKQKSCGLTARTTLDIKGLRQIGFTDEDFKSFSRRSSEPVDFVQKLIEEEREVKDA
jgi:hypothetical protein